MLFNSRIFWMVLKAKDTLLKRRTTWLLYRPSVRLNKVLFTLSVMKGKEVIPLVSKSMCADDAGFQSHIES